MPVLFAGVQPNTMNDDVVVMHLGVEDEPPVDDEDGNPFEVTLIILTIYPPGLLNDRGAFYVTARGAGGQYAQFAGWETEAFGGWCADVGAPEWLSDVVSNAAAGMNA